MVTHAELLSRAAFAEGRHAQAFPTFGSERTGAPVTSFCRISDRPIRSREPIAHPDAVIVQDPTLIHQVRLFDGLADEGYLLVNTSRELGELGLAEVVERLPEGRARALAASEIARRHLGRPLPNAALLGGFAALSGLISIESVARALAEKFPAAVAERNAAAAREAYEQVAAEAPEAARA